MSKKFVVYMHTAPNGKSYIGQTNNFEKRCKEHRLGSKRTPITVFSKAISKHGWDNFIHVLLAEGLTLDDANRIEIELIATHCTMVPNGYNLRSGGRNGLHSEETRKRMSVAQLGHATTPEARTKMATAKMGKPLSLSHRAKLSDAGTGRIVQSITRRKISTALNGHSVSAETRSRISAAKINPSAETRQKISSSKTGVLISAETRNRMSASQKIAWDKRRKNGTDAVSCETRAKMAASKIGRKQSSELIKKRIGSGAAWTEKANEKRRAALVGKPKTDEARKNMAAAQMARRAKKGPLCERPIPEMPYI